MSNQGLLINYEYCTGCHACEVACKKHLDLPKGQFGIKVFQIGPWKIGEEKWNYEFIPVITDLCDMCADRVEAGKWPSCVHTCQSLAIENGTEEELVEKAAGLTGKYSLFFLNR